MQHLIKAMLDKNPDERYSINEILIIGPTSTHLEHMVEATYPIKGVTFKYELQFPSPKLGTSFIIFSWH